MSVSRKLKERTAHLADPFRVLAQEQLERMQLLRHTLDVIQPIDAHNDLDAAEPVLELFDPLLHTILLQILSYQSVIHS